MNAASPTLAGVLAGLIRDRGPGLLGERRRLLGLLRDRLPREVRAIRILMMAFDGGVPGRLSGTEPSGPDIGREGGLLAADTGLGLEVARQAVETWAVALCGYVPTAAGASDADLPLTGPRPSVRKLSARPQAEALDRSPIPPGTVQPRSSWIRRWPGIALGVVLLLGGIARLVEHTDDTRPQPPAAAPAAPAGPAAPAAPAAPAPSAPAVTTTPEGFALISGGEPYPVFATQRIKQSANTLGVWFGVKVDARPVSYYVAFAFDKGQRKGQGLVGATQSAQQVSSGALAADRVVVTGTGENYLRVAGPLQKNAMGLPGLCAFAQVSDTLDRIDLVPNSGLVIFALDKDGGCDMQNRVGSGTLK